MALLPSSYIFWKRALNLFLVSNGCTPIANNNIFTRGNKFFELTNHLGNVLATVSDREFYVKYGAGDESNGGCDQGTAKDNLEVPLRGTETSFVARLQVDLVEGFDSNNGDDFTVYTDDNLLACEPQTTPPAGADYYYMPDVVSANDYYAFGMQMPGRKFGATGRYGFNGKERDKEMNSLTAYDYGFRIYNPAIGKFLSVDPLVKEYPFYSPYHFAGNSPIWAIDLDGAEPRISNFFSINVGGFFRPITFNETEKIANFTRAEVVPRVGGVLKAGTGGLIMAGGALSMEVPVVGVPVFIYGADVGGAGLRQIWFGSPQKTMTQQVMEDHGMPAEEAEFLDNTATGILSMSPFTRSSPLGKPILKTNKPIAASEESAGSRDLNPLRGNMNCAGCTLAGDATLKGFPATALNHGETDLGKFLSWFGAKKMDLHSSPKTVISAMEKMKEGSTGVVFGNRGIGKIGHLFNVTKKDGVVQFIDFQRAEGSRVLNPNTIMDNGNFINLFFLNTTK